METPSWRNVKQPLCMSSRRLQPKSGQRHTGPWGIEVHHVMVTEEVDMCGGGRATGALLEDLQDALRALGQVCCSQRGCRLLNIRDPG